MAKTQQPKSNYWDEMKRIGSEALEEKAIGRPKAIATPIQMWEYACEYFKKVDNDPYKRQDFIKSGDKAGRKVDLDNIKPYTWNGFENYLFEKKIITRLEHYKNNLRGTYDAFVDVIARIDRIMYDQKFTGATVGAFKENIISHELKLKDPEVNFTPVTAINVTVTRKK